MRLTLSHCWFKLPENGWKAKNKHEKNFSPAAQQPSSPAAQQPSSPALYQNQRLKAEFKAVSLALSRLFFTSKITPRIYFANDSHGTRISFINKNILQHSGEGQSVFSLLNENLNDLITGVGGKCNFKYEEKA